ncbi:phage tail protein [Endozoicomonas lisbonensis]|uniref:Phage tail protein n=1 Tax=Endozoicomonas lisbonensis TaxID=3120522 RepID=A0ABV2SGZ2_9GAMM
MIKLKLKWWMNGEKEDGQQGELAKLTKAAQAWFDRVADWAKWPVLQLDPETCAPGLLHLIAWQRGITQFPGEPERQYRLRTKHAYVNAADAGSVIGFQNIFARMELGAVSIAERSPDKPWDVITLQVTDTTVARDAAYLNWIIQTYGRTCRRYEWEIVTPISNTVRSASFSCDYGTYYCKE